MLFTATASANALPIKALVEQFVRVEINSGTSSSFWFDDRVPLGRLINLTELGDCIDIGIPINATVEYAVQNYQRRRYRVDHLIMIEHEVYI